MAAATRMTATHVCCTGRAGVRSAAVISAGFSEVGPAGAKLERALLENARRHRLRVVGPNCLGLMRPELGLNATFARGAALPGREVVRAGERDGDGRRGHRVCAPSGSDGGDVLSIVSAGGVGEPCPSCTCAAS